MSNNVRSIRSEQITGQIEISDSSLVIRNLETNSDEVIRSVKGFSDRQYKSKRSRRSKFIVRHGFDGLPTRFYIGRY